MASDKNRGGDRPTELIEALERREPGSKDRKKASEKRRKTAQLPRKRANFSADQEQTMSVGEDEDIGGVENRTQAVDPWSEPSDESIPPEGRTFGTEVPTGSLLDEDVVYPSDLESTSPPDDRTQGLVAQPKNKAKERAPSESATRVLMAVPKKEKRADESGGFASTYDDNGAPPGSLSSVKSSKKGRKSGDEDPTQFQDSVSRPSPAPGGKVKGLKSARVGTGTSVPYESNLSKGALISPDFQTEDEDDDPPDRLASARRAAAGDREKTDKSKVKKAPLRNKSVMEENGERFGRYRLLAPFGKSTFTELHLAAETRPDGSKRTCVIKRLIEERAEDDHALGLFEQEALVGGRVRHPNIVAQLDSGEIDEVPYIALEFVDGLSLRHLDDLASPKHIPISIAVEIANRIARALSHAHRASSADGRRLKLVHRNVCPETILLSREGEVKLSDFSVADFSGKTVDTSIGPPRGNIRYMPPEQYERRRVDERSDLFALGCVIIELITGGALFPEGVSAEDDPDAHVLKRIEGARQIPAELRRLVVEMTKQEPGSRPASAATVAADLRRILADTPQNVTLAEYVSGTIIGHVPNVDNAGFARFVDKVRRAALRDEDEPPPIERTEPEMEAPVDVLRPPQNEPMPYPTTIGVLMRDVERDAIKRGGGVPVNSFVAGGRASAPASRRGGWGSAPKNEGARNVQVNLPPQGGAPMRGESFVLRVKSAIFQVYGEVPDKRRAAPKGPVRTGPVGRMPLDAKPRTFDVKERKASSAGGVLVGLFFAFLMVGLVFLAMLKL